MPKQSMLAASTQARVRKKRSRLIGFFSFTGSRFLSFMEETVRKPARATPSAIQKRSMKLPVTS